MGSKLEQDHKKGRHSLLRNAAVPVFMAFIVMFTLIITRHMWEPLELKSYDLRVQVLEKLNLGNSSYTGNVVVVGMLEDRMVIEKPLIFWYPEFGRFLIKMLEYESSLVSLDLIPIHALGEKILDAASTIMEDEINDEVEEFLEMLGESTDNSLLGPMLYVSDKLPIIQGTADGTVPYYYPLMAFMENVHQASVKLTPDPDNIIRRQRLVSEDGQKPFAYASYLLGTGKQHGSEHVLMNYSIAEEIPVYSFTDLLNGKYEKGLFKDKIVLLGYITDYVDVHSTPLGYRLPGVIVHAITIETLLSGTALEPVGTNSDILIIALLCILGLSISVRTRPLPALALTFIAMAAFVVFNIIVFNTGTVLSIFPHVFSPLLVFSTIYPYRYLVEERGKRKLYRTFSYFMDSKIIDSLVEKDPESLLEGKSIDVCVMFVDLRGFTALSNSHDARTVVSFLNIYFSRITGIIQEYGGVVDKFIGDAILAFFTSGKAPVIDALTASEKIIREIGRINETGELEPLLGDLQIKIGIGVHFGKVIMGNIGSEKKMDFTIIGEAVNIASRIEGMTKKLNVQILTTEQIRNAANNQFDFTHMGAHPIKGLNKPIDIYSIMYKI
jgi:class 3 adenylate cyclase